MDTAQTLLLNQGFEPIKVISWQRAVTLMWLGKVEVVRTYEKDVRAVTFKVRMPAVVRLLRFVRRKQPQVSFSRRNLFARDENKCQYCRKLFEMNELTYDHVVPRSKGGRTTWENIVSACYLCNRRKANRTPVEAGMKLLTEPARPTWMPSVQIRVSARSVPDAWRDYVYWTAEIDNEEGGAD